MSWIGELGEKLETKVSDGLDSVKEGLGIGSPENEVPSTQFLNAGEIPPVAADQAQQKPPSPSQRAYDQTVEKTRPPDRVDRRRHR